MVRCRADILTSVCAWYVPDQPRVSLVFVLEVFVSSLWVWVCPIPCCVVTTCFCRSKDRHVCVCVVTEGRLSVEGPIRLCTIYHFCAVAEGRSQRLSGTFAAFTREASWASLAAGLCPDIGGGLTGFAPGNALLLASGLESPLLCCSCQVLWLLVLWNVFLTAIGLGRASSASAD